MCVRRKEGICAALNELDVCEEDIEWMTSVLQIKTWRRAFSHTDIFFLCVGSLCERVRASRGRKLAVCYPQVLCVCVRVCLPSNVCVRGHISVSLCSFIWQPIGDFPSCRSPWRICSQSWKAVRANRGAAFTQLATASSRNSRHGGRNTRR